MHSKKHGGSYYEDFGIRRRCYRLQSCAQPVPRGKGRYPAIARRLGGGDSEERSADKGQVFAAMLPEKNVLFAFALSAGHRERDYIASIDLRKITIGQLSSAPSNEQLISQIFDGMKFKVVYQPNMGDYLLCHAAFVVPVAFACYKTGGDLKKVRQGTAYPVWQELEKDTGKYLEQA